MLDFRYIHFYDNNKDVLDAEVSFYAHLKFYENLELYPKCHRITKYKWFQFLQKSLSIF